MGVRSASLDRERLDLVQAADAEWIVQYVVSVRGGGSASVDAPNWLAALGIGLDQFGDVGSIDRLACEVLVNGTVLARDARTGLGYVVRPIGPIPTREPRAPGASQLQRDDDTEVGGSLLERLVPTEGASDEDSELLEFALPDEPGFTEEQPLPAQEDSAAVRELPTSGWNPVHEVAPVEAPDEDEQATVHLDAPVDPVDALADVDEDSDVFVEDDITDRFQRRQVPPVVVPGLCSVRDAVAIGPACEAALGSLQAVVPSQAGSVILQEADGKLRFALVSGPNAERLTGSVLPKGAGIAGFCLARGTSLIVRRAGSDPRFYSEVDRETGFTTHSVLCVPIVCEPDVCGPDVCGPDVCGPDVCEPDIFGCIELLNPPPSRPFLGDDLRAAQDVAEALAVCIRRERSA